MSKESDDTAEKQVQLDGNTFEFEYNPDPFAPTFNVSATLNGTSASGTATASARASCAFSWTAELQN